MADSPLPYVWVVSPPTRSLDSAFYLFITLQPNNRAYPFSVVVVSFLCIEH